MEAFGRAYEDYLRVVHGLEKLELENVVEASEIVCGVFFVRTHILLLDTQQTGSEQNQ